jgi:addiction module HigA family antidote
MALKNGMRPVRPGEILKADFLKPSGLSVNTLAKALHVLTPRINDIVLKRRGISADTAMRLARYFDGDALPWLNLQTIYDLRPACRRTRERPRATGPTTQEARFAVGFLGFYHAISLA